MSLDAPLPSIRQLIELDPDHPGFRDPIYRRRRDAIAEIALRYRSGDPVPDAPYTPEEHDVWRLILQGLEPLHESRAAREIIDLQRTLGLSRERIPQLAEVNLVLGAATGFGMEPVAGLVEAGTFLVQLGLGSFLSTQYMRHASRPLYTPEPDVVHELVGHAATLTHPGIAALNRELGRAAAEASAEETLRLERVYWYALEFGLVEEAGIPKAFGAGILSSRGELEQFDDGPELCAWDLDRMARTPYDPTNMQQRLFVAPSFTGLLSGVSAWVSEGRWRSC